MILFNIVVLSLAALATADGKAKDKRGIVDYNLPSKYSSSSIYTKSAEDGASYDKGFRNYHQGSVDSVPAYTKSIQALLQKSGPALPPREYQQYYQQQPQQQVESQAATYSAPVASSSAGAGLDKYAYFTQPQKAQYSSAADVSSFSYSSPVVTYNNHGLLQQLAGKSSTPSHGSPYSSASSPKSQYQSSPKFQYVSAPAPQQSYSSAYPSAQGLTSPKAFSSPSAYSGGANPYSGASNAYSASQNVYSSSPSAYSQPQAPSYEDASNAYQQISQKALFTAAPVQEQQQQQQQQIYQSSPSAAQKFTYVQSPLAYQTQKGSAQLSYPAQEYSGAPQAAASTNYDGDQNLSKLYITEQTSPEQQQQQYYNVVPQPKYTKSGVTYA